MFPRVVLRDARRTSLSLSHFCPTAAALLFDAPGPDAIVDAPQSLIGDGDLEGLDAADTWSPLLRPSMLMDMSAYDSWERHAIDLLTRDHDLPWHAVDRLEHATTAIAQWTPGSNRTLDQCVDDAFASEAGSWTPATGSWKLAAGFAVAVRAVPAPLHAPSPCAPSSRFLIAANRGIEQHARAVNRWLAARLFGAWIAYQSTGLLVIVRLLRVALDTLVVELMRMQKESLQRRDVLEAIRQSDYLIVHLADSQRLATLLSNPCLSSTAS
jgi:hypothetical protein